MKVVPPYVSTSIKSVLYPYYSNNAPTSQQTYVSNKQGKLHGDFLITSPIHYKPWFFYILLNT